MLTLHGVAHTACTPKNWWVPDLGKLGTTYKFTDKSQSQSSPIIIPLMWLQLAAGLFCKLIIPIPLPRSRLPSQLALRVLQFRKLQNMSVLTCSCGLNPDGIRYGPYTVFNGINVIKTCNSGFKDAIVDLKML